MSRTDALLELHRGFRLGDDVSLTELRSSTWLSRLETAHKLRLLGRNKVVGVVVDVAVWDALEELLHDLVEDSLVAEQWGVRVDHERMPAALAGPLVMRMLEDRERADSDT